MKNIIFISNLKLANTREFFSIFGEPLDLYFDEFEGFDFESFIANFIENIDFNDEYYEELRDASLEKIINEVYGEDAVPLIENLIGGKIKNDRGKIQ